MSATFIANIAWPRPDGWDAGTTTTGKLVAGQEGKWKRMGSLWYDAATNRASVKLTGWVPGWVKARPPPSGSGLRQPDPPHLDGDLLVVIGANERDGTVEYQWCGYIISKDDEQGALYKLNLMIQPLVAINGKAGLWLKVSEP